MQRVPVFDLIRPLREAANIADRPPQMPYMAQTQSPDSGYIAPKLHASSPVYRAERKLIERMADQNPWVLTIDQAQAYGQAVALRAAVRYSRGSWPLQIVQDPTGPSYLNGTIKLNGPTYQVTLLHEIAHHLVGDEEGHVGPFLDAYVYLISTELSQELASAFLFYMQ